MIFGFGENKDFDCERRIITLEFTDFYFVNCYYPNSQGSEEHYDYRCKWDELIYEHLQQLRYKKPVVICGDFNVTLTNDDIYKQSKWVDINSEGFQSTERENLIRILDSGFVDTFRHVHPNETNKFTWWSNRLYKRADNRGWRLDYFLCTRDISEYIVESNMLFDIIGSDHCPIVLEINIPMTYIPVERREIHKKRILYSHLVGSDRYSDEYLLENADFTRLWNSVDWIKAEKELARLQMAAAKSAYLYNMDLIRKWQNRIVFSLDARLLAVRHVASMGGGKGIDSITWYTPEDKMTAVLILSLTDYRKTICSTEEQLLEQFPDCKELLNIYTDALHIEAQLECEADFERGFRLGAKILFELLDTEM